MRSPPHRLLTGPPHKWLQLSPPKATLRILTTPSRPRRRSLRFPARMLPLVNMAICSTHPQKVRLMSLLSGRTRHPEPFVCLSES